MKNVKMAALLVAAGFMAMSCSQQEDGIDTGGAEKTTTLRVSIGKAGASTRAAGADEPGIGDESKINDQWVIFAKKGGTYRAFTSTEVGGGAADGDGSNDVAELRDVSASAKLYVIVNADANNLNTGGEFWATFIQRTDITAPEIETLISEQTKSQIHAYSTALQAAVIANSTNPIPGFVNGMLMTGSATPPADADQSQTPVAVPIDITREYSKVDFTVAHSVGANLQPGGSHPATLVSIDGITVHRVRPSIAPFAMPTGVGPQVDDTNLADNNNPSATATNYAYTYNFVNAPQPGVTDAKAYFYVTPNLLNTRVLATHIVVEATLEADFGSGGITRETRYYGAVIADADVNAYNTYKNTIYKITGTINSLGEPDIPSVLDGKADLDVKVQLKDWSVRNVNVDM